MFNKVISAIKRNTQAYLIISLGCLIMTISINTFFVPHHLLSGGLSGLAMIVYFLTGFPMGTFTLLINIPLFYIAYRYISPQYCFNGLYGLIVFSLMWDATTFLAQMNLVDDVMLSSIYGGAFMGLGAAMIYRVNAHTGGLDIINAIINREYGIGMGTMSILFNVLLMSVAAYMFGIKPALYTMTSAFVTGTVINRVIDGFDFKKNILIVSDEYEQLSTELMQALDRGATYINAQGAYTKKDKKIIFIVVRLRQVMTVRQIVQQVDPTAFMIITDVRDVVGKGFTLPIDNR